MSAKKNSLRRRQSRPSSNTFFLALFLLACDGSGSEVKKGSRQTAPTEASISSRASTLRIAPREKERLLKSIEILRYQEPTERAISSLLRLLDGPTPISTQAAFAISQLCSTAQAEAETSLIIALSSRLMRGELKDEEEFSALSMALAACGSERAETTLRRLFLIPATAQKSSVLHSACLGLGEIARRNGSLKERTLSALFDAAEKTADPYLLYPLSRLSKINHSLEARLLEVASNLLTREKTKHKRIAISAMAVAGATAAAPLAQILISPRFSGPERAAAAQALARLGGSGQKELDKALAEMLLRGLPLKPTQSKWLPLRATLNALETPKYSKALLKEVAEVFLPGAGDPAARAQRRRMLWLRCRSADLLAGTHSKYSLLNKCGPSQGYESQAARLRVLDRGALKGERADIYAPLLESKIPKIRAQALLMLVAHNEYPERLKALGRALKSKQVADISAAAQVLGLSGDLANRQQLTPPSILDHMVTLVQRDDLPRQSRVLLLAAIGQLGRPEAIQTVQKYCSEADPVLRAAAGRSIHALSHGAQICTNPADENLPAPSRPQAPSSTKTKPFTLAFDTDLGPLKLHFTAEFDENTRKYLKSQIEAGFFDDLKVGHAQTGFAMQIGDQDGDGYEDIATPLLRPSLKPQSLKPNSFGLTSFAAGAESGWLFILLDEAPQLWGKKSQLGYAEGPLSALMYGDPLRNPRILKN